MDKEQLVLLSPLEKFKYAHTIRVMHPNFFEALQRIHETHELSKYMEKPRSLLILGDSGLGKSTLFDYYKGKYGEHRLTKDGTIKTIICAEIPRPASYKSLVETLLKEMGDRRYSKGNTSDSIDRFVGLVKDVGVELILLDEMQHFMKPGNKSVNHDVADSFKTLVNKTKLPFVMFGTKDASAILTDNEQIEGRFEPEFVFQPYGFKTDDEKKVFKSLLNEFDKQLPFKNSSHLASETTAKRIYQACTGNMRILHYLICDAVLLAAKDGADKLELIHLKNAYKKSVSFRKGNPNPF